MWTANYLLKLGYNVTVITRNELKLKRIFKNHIKYFKKVIALNLESVV